VDHRRPVAAKFEDDFLDCSQNGSCILDSPAAIVVVALVEIDCVGLDLLLLLLLLFLGVCIMIIPWVRVRIAVNVAVAGNVRVAVAQMLAASPLDIQRVEVENLKGVGESPWRWAAMDRD
jgi:hypothetical protein